MKKIILACLCSALPLLASAQSMAATQSDFNIAGVEASSTKTGFAEYFADSGEFPTSLEDIGASESDFNQIEHVSINQNNGTLLFNLSSSFGEKQWLSLIPKIDNYYVSGYICKTTLGDDIAGNSDCATDVPYEALDVIVDPSLFLSAIIATSGIRVNYAENYTSTGVLPTTLAEIGIDSSTLNTTYFNNAIVEPETGAIIFTLSPIFGINQWFTLIPRTNSSGYLGWSCQTTLPVSIKGGYCGASISVDDVLN